MDRQLLKLARNKQLAHPAMLDEFDINDWIVKYQALYPGHSIERGFLEGARWLNTQFKRVKSSRLHYSFITDEPLTYDALISAHIGSANHFFCAMAAEALQAVEANPTASLEEHLSFRFSLTNGESGLPPDHLNMLRLDSLCGPIWDLYQNRHDLRVLFPDNCPHMLSAINFFAYESDLVQLTHSFKKIWQELLYGGMELFADSKGVLLSSASEHLDLVKVIYEYRRDRHNGTNGLRISNDLHQGRLTHVARLGWQRYIQCVGTDVLSIGNWSELSDSVQTAALYAYLSPYYMIDEYLHPLFDASPDPAVKSTECQNLLHIWLHLAVIAAQLKERYGQMPAPRQWEDLLKLCPRFSRNTLVERLAESTGLAVEQVNAAIDLLLYEAKSLQHDLWSRPLVKVDEHVLIPISAPLTASISRNFDIWLSIIDPKGKQRGRLFERYLLAVLEDCRKTNPIMAGLTWLGAVQFRGPSKVVEEIDLVFSFGSLLVVCELRSRRAPITPLDYHNDFSDNNGIIHKARQARRKAQHIQQGLGAFCSQYFPHLSDASEVTVLPLVIVSGPYHAGFAYDDVPILDPHLLRHFLKDGEVRFGGRADSDTAHDYGYALYSDVESAQREFAGYAANPALIRVYRTMAQPRLHRYPLRGEQAQPVRSLFYELSGFSFEEQLAVAQSVSGGKLRKIDR